MKIDGRNLSTEAKAFIRRTAVQRFWEGEKPSAVMDNFGLSRKSVFPRLRKTQAEWLEALAPRAQSHIERAGGGRSGALGDLGQPAPIRF